MWEIFFVAHFWIFQIRNFFSLWIAWLLEFWFECKILGWFRSWGVSGAERGSIVSRTVMAWCGCSCSSSGSPCRVRFGTTAQKCWKCKFFTQRKFFFPGECSNLLRRTFATDRDGRPASRESSAGNGRTRLDSSSRTGDCAPWACSPATWDLQSQCTELFFFQRISCVHIMTAVVLRIRWSFSSHLPKKSALSTQHSDTWPIDWLIVWFIHWSIDWLIDWLIELRLIDLSLASSIDWLIERLFLVEIRLLHVSITGFIHLGEKSQIRQLDVSGGGWDEAVMSARCHVRHLQAPHPFVHRLLRRRSHHPLWLWAAKMFALGFIWHHGFSS